VPVGAEVMTLAKQVESDLKLKEDKTKAIKYFTIFGFDPYTAGSTAYETGAVVGLPINLSYKSAADIDKKRIMNLVC